jgi:tRNA A-37 threonylcarbamoyl transferase component Bud32
VDGRVAKRYRGSDASERLRNEVDAIRRTAGRVPAPTVLDVDEASCTITLARLPGRNGQVLIDKGFENGVLEAAGRTLRALHARPGRQRGRTVTTDRRTCCTTRQRCA